MKNIILIFILATLCFGCDKDDFDFENPNVEQFVNQLKNGTYNEYEIGEDGQKLWTKIPNFSKEHIPLLIDLSKDTSLVNPWEHFPLNPASSIPPYRINEGNSCIMVSEYLLWCVEGIIQGNDFPSLTPILVNNEENPEKRLNGEEMQSVKMLYQDWWNKYGEIENENKSPLAETVYRWR